MNKDKPTVTSVGRRLILYIFLVYLLFRVISALSVQGFSPLSDSACFMDMASKPLFNGDFLFGSRPFTVPLFYKLLPNNPWVIGTFQLMLSILSWGLLAAAVTQNIGTPLLKSIAFTLILIFSLSMPVILWDFTLMSESISLSLMACFIANWLWLLRDWRIHKLVILCITSFFWIFTRDTNAYILLIVSMLVMAANLVARDHKRYLVLASFFFLFSVAQIASSTAGQRWVFPLLNVLAQRILPDPVRTVYFIRKGMPVSPALLRLRLKWASSDNGAFCNDKALQEFRNWFYKNGKSSYISFLLSHPSTAVLEPITQFKLLLSPHDYIAPVGFSPILQTQLEKIVYFRVNFSSYIISLIVGAGMLLICIKQKRDIHVLVPIVLIALVYPHAFIVWHGDAMDVGRHAVQIGVQFRLGLWMLLFFLLDMITRSNNFRRRVEKIL